MGRRRSSGAEDVIELTARWPWWIGVIAALVAFVVLRIVSGIEVAPTPNTKELGALVIRQFIKSIATVGQWVLPFLFLIGSAVAALNQRKRRALYNDVAANGSSRAGSELTWQDFERLIGEYFNRRGFSVIETGGGGADVGVDLTMKKGADRYLVQCKQWRAISVGVEPVRELYGLMAAHRAAGSFVVTSGRFTEEAKRFAAGREIELIGGDQLEREIRRYVISPKSSGAASSATEQASAAIKRVCPSCGAAVVLRKAIKGSSAGQSFYGCSNFPKCRGTRPA